MTRNLFGISGGFLLVAAFTPPLAPFLETFLLAFKGPLLCCIFSFFQYDIFIFFYQIICWCSDIFLSKLKIFQVNRCMNIRVSHTILICNFLMFFFNTSDNMHILLRYHKDSNLKPLICKSVQFSTKLINFSLFSNTYIIKNIYMNFTL